MFSFRQKIFVSYILIFLVFLFSLFPMANYIVQRIVKTAMENRGRELIERIRYAPNNEALVRLLKEQKPLIFFRVSLITHDRKVLYDSHMKRILGPRFSQEFIVDHPEVIEALKTGVGYNEDYSDLLGQKFAYLALRFDFHGETYVLRTAFPFRYVMEMQTDFELGFLLLATAILGLFSLMSWIIINHFTKPIQRIINGVRPYQERQVETLPLFDLRNENPRDDFTKLASTLNSLSIEIQNQLDTLRTAGLEKQVLLESLVEGVIAVDSRLNPTFINSSAQKLLGDTIPSKCLEILALSQNTGKVQSDSIEVKTDGKTNYLNIVAAPKNDYSGAILVVQDKTQDYRLLEMRKDFIANASHELKTPITIIRGFAETLHDNPLLPEETLKDVTTKIVRNCERMTTLVKDLLALADVENLPASRVEKMNLIDILQKGRQTVLAIFPEAQITLHRTDALIITGDPELIEMALTNLINNAAKYSNPPIRIDVYAEDLGDRVSIKIADKGIGIPASSLDQIFERFYRVDKARSRKVGGSGLGLSIVKTIIEKHFGTISVASTVGEGTTFSITLPKTLRM